jgi:lysine biosynthesis protein LysW
MVVVNCPSCEAEVKVEFTPEIGKRADCSTCHAELIIVSINPVELEMIKSNEKENWLNDILLGGDIEDPLEEFEDDEYFDEDEISDDEEFDDDEEYDDDDDDLDFDDEDDDLDFDDRDHRYRY